MSSPYRRVIIKLSGEALGVDGKLFCHEKFDRVAQVLTRVQRLGIQTAVVIGGGNVWRGRRGDSLRMGAVAADQMGMLGTLQNSLYMRDALARQGAGALVVSGVDIPRFAESYNTVAVLEHLEQGKIVLLACGLGNPCFSTDSAVVLRAIELECDAILMAKNVDGVYSADPNLDPQARLFAGFDLCPGCGGGFAGHGRRRLYHAPGQRRAFGAGFRAGAAGEYPQGALRGPHGYLFASLGGYAPCHS